MLISFEKAMAQAVDLVFARPGKPHWLTAAAYGGRPCRRGKGLGHKQQARAQAKRHRRQRRR
ncbi:MAG: hypothetical protein P4L73_13505 [Caulobacteraceae bacterium]|nr:hypothetical protein [Caulobacteraceae bacterium]